MIGMSWEQMKSKYLKEWKIMNNTENTLWVEKYRLDTLEGYVGNEHILEKVSLYRERRCTTSTFIWTSWYG